MLHKFSGEHGVNIVSHYRYLFSFIARITKYRPIYSDSIIEMLITIYVFVNTLGSGWYA